MNRFDWLKYRLQLLRTGLERVEPGFASSLQDTLDNRPDQLGEMLDNQEFAGELHKDVAVVRHLFGDDKAPDLVVREFPVFGTAQGALLYFSSMASDQHISEDLLRPLMGSNSVEQGDEPPTAGEIRTQVMGLLVHVGHIAQTLKLAHAADELARGKALLFIDGDPHALLIDVTGYTKRAIGAPESEIVIRGPRDGFVEDLETNLSLIRRRLATPLLRVEPSRIGRWTQTQVAVLYVEGLTPDELIGEVRRRLSGIELDGVLETEYIEEFLEDQTWTLFPQLFNTERPDVAVAQLLEGRVVILVNGTPFVLVAPGTFNMFMQAPSDYYQRWDYSSLLRFMRWIMVGAVVYLTAIYVAVTSFSPSMLPTGLLISFAAAREKVPFTVLTEALVLETVFEVLREAGIRLPRQVGQTISIVGVLVIGQAAVQASIMSAPMVILVAFTGIASFVIPSYNLGISLRILRFPMILLGGTMGLFGIVMGTLIVLAHLTALRSFGVPYLVGITPPTATSGQDTLIRLPRWKLLKRPVALRKATTWRITPQQNPRRGSEQGHDQDVRSRL